jgi:hypothetical protein
MTNGIYFNQRSNMEQVGRVVEGRALWYR